VISLPSHFITQGPLALSSRAYSVNRFGGSSKSARCFCLALLKCRSNVSSTAAALVTDAAYKARELAQLFFEVTAKNSVSSCSTLRLPQCGQ
jgi:hypothetical protein